MLLYYVIIRYFIAKNTSVTSVQFTLEFKLEVRDFRFYSVNMAQSRFLLIFKKKANKKMPKPEQDNIGTSTPVIQQEK